MIGAVDERTVPLATLPIPGRRPSLHGVRVGQVVTSATSGRRFRVQSASEWVIGPYDQTGSEDMATGPYAALQALDDKHCRVIWPRAWYLVPGQQMSLFGRSA